MNINIKNVKICVTIPTDYTEKVRQAICNAGAGTTFGNYSDCSSITKSIGTFKPINNANPFIGELNKLEIVEEDKLEVLCEISKVKDVIKVLREVHPYEEPAIDIIPLISEDDLN